MAAFDPYHRWLGIPPEDQPPNHYRLLGLVQYESDPEVIENAANQRMAHLRSFQAGRNASESQRLLNEVAAARICLLNVEKKAAYDEGLRQSEKPPAVSPGPVEAPPPLVPPQSPSPVSGPAPPPIEVKEEETWLEGHLHGHPHHAAHSRFSRGTLFAMGGVSAAVVLVILFLLAQGGRSRDAILVFDLAGANRDNLRLSIDGMERALSPSGPLEFVCAPGPHEVTAARPGYPPFTTEISLGERERLTLVPKWGQPTELALAWAKGDREGGRLFLDGHLQELALIDSEDSDTVVLPVSPGAHVVRIEREGFAPFETKVDAPAGETKEMTPTFAPVGSSPQGSAVVQNPEAGKESEPVAPATSSETAATSGSGTADPASMASKDPAPQVEPGGPGSASVNRFPVPPAEEQTQKLARVDEAFGVQQADTREKKVELAQRLLDVSPDARDTPLDLFAILHRGQELAVEAEEVPLALKIVAAQGDAFEIDVLAEQAAVLTRIADTAIEARVVDALVMQGWEVLDAAISAGRYELAGKLIGAFYAKVGSPPWQPHGARIAKWQTVAKPLAGLEANADDPGANAFVGRWYLDLGEAEKAFPFMAKIQREPLSSLAKAELTPPDTAEQQAALGDRWWDMAESVKDKDSQLEEAFRDRAIHWYKVARPNLNSVILSEKIANRIGEAIGPPRDVAVAQSTRSPLPEGKVVEKGKWEDLLAAMNPLRDVTRGQWQRQGSIITSITPRSTVMFPVAVQGDYELEVQLSVVSRSPQGLTAVLPVGSRTCDVFLSYNARPDILANVNGQPYTTSVRELTPGQLTTALFRVTTEGGQKHINVVINGGPYFQWQGEETSLSGTGTCQLPRMNQPGLMNGRDQYAVHSARFRLLDGEARLLTGEGLPPRRYLLTGDVGYYQGTVFESFAPEGSVLVGLRFTPGGLGVGDLKPVYRAGDGKLQEGPWIGGSTQPADSVIAKEGYGVGAVMIDTQNGYLKGVAVRFYRLGKNGLDSADTYDSPRLGETGIDGVFTVETRGRPATGIHGLWNPGQIVSLGLATLRPAEADLWRHSDAGRAAYLPLLDLEPIQCTVAEMCYSRHLGIGTTDPEAWPIIDENSQSCPEFLYAPAPSRLVWKLTPATMKSFSAIGYSVEDRAISFRVLVDNQTVFESSGSGVAEIKVDLPPGEQLELQADVVGNEQSAESFWLFPRVHSRSADSVTSLDEKTGRGSKLVGKPPLSQSVAPRPKSHKPLRPLYPATGPCREFLYAHPPSRVVYRIPEGAKRFSAIGYCVASKAVRFRVSVNGTEVYSRGPLGIDRIEFNLPRQANTIELWTEPLPNARISRDDYAFWCFPRFYK